MLFNPKKVQFREFEWSGSKLKGPAKWKKNIQIFQVIDFVLAFDVIDRATNSCVVLWLWKTVATISLLTIYLYTRSTYINFYRSSQEAPI